LKGITRVGAGHWVMLVLKRLVPYAKGSIFHLMSEEM